MKTAFFSTTPTDKRVFQQHQTNANVDLTFFDVHLTDKTVPLAKGFQAVCVFVNDHLDKHVIETLSEFGIKLIALRCAGFNNIDRETAQKLNMTILRVPAYSPMAIAEHALALMMTLNRKTHKAYNRIRDHNFTLEGLLGFDMHQKTAGIVGTGKIGQQLIPILKGLGMNILAYDPYPNDQTESLGAQYVDFDTLIKRSDIISLHLPLLPNTYHLINADTIQQMKENVMLINTSRGGLMDTKAMIKGLKSKKIGYLGIDVYELEDNLFFEDHTNDIIEDDDFERLITFPNVLITAHQAFFTQQALDNIAETTLQNLIEFSKGEINSDNCVLCET